MARTSVSAFTFPVGFVRSRPLSSRPYAGFKHHRDPARFALPASTVGTRPGCPVGLHVPGPLLGAVPPDGRVRVVSRRRRVRRLPHYTRAVVEEGQEAPDFELVSDSGERVRLSDLQGRPVVLFFYPRDRTPGCSKEARGFRDAYDAFLEHEAVILGVSPDSEEPHVRFKQKYGLPFTLLADPEKEAAEAYGVWVERNLYGKKSFGVRRSTFVIGRDGTVLKAIAA